MDGVSLTSFVGHCQYISHFSTNQAANYTYVVTFFNDRSGCDIEVAQLVFQTNVGIITFSVITTLVLATAVFLITNIAIGWRSKDRRKSLLSIFLPSLIANVLSEQIMNNKTQRSLDSQQLARINRECNSLSNRYKTLKGAMDRRVKLNTKPTVFKK